MMLDWLIELSVNNFLTSLKASTEVLTSFSFILSIKFDRQSWSSNNRLLILASHFLHTTITSEQTFYAWYKCLALPFIGVWSSQPNMHGIGFWVHMRMWLTYPLRFKCSSHWGTSHLNYILLKKALSRSLITSDVKRYSLQTGQFFWLFGRLSAQDMQKNCPQFP